MNIRSIFLPNFFLQRFVVNNGQTNTCIIKVLFWITSAIISKTTSISVGGFAHRYLPDTWPSVNHPSALKIVSGSFPRQLLIHSSRNVSLSSDPLFRVVILNRSRSSITPSNNYLLDSPYMNSCFVYAPDMWNTFNMSFPDISASCNLKAMACKAGLDESDF